MPDKEWLVGVFNRKKVSITDKLLAVLIDGEAPQKTIGEIRSICISHGLRKAKDLSISGFMHSASQQGKVVCIDSKWSLTPAGREYLAQKNLAPPSQTVLTKARDDVRKNLSSITNPTIQKFVEEAILCLEHGLLRSAVVMSWIGAVAILYDHVVKNDLAKFNAEAVSRFPKWKKALDVAGLTNMKEYDFLQVIDAIGVIDKNVKHELEECLKRRNSCGHPNAYQIREQTVAHQIETLILHVYAKF